MLMVSNKNYGLRNKRVTIFLSGHPKSEGTIGASVYIGFGHYGINNGAGFHTSVKDAKRIREELDKAIKTAQRGE